MAVSDSQPLSVGDLRYLLENGMGGGVVLYDGASEQNINTTLSRSIAGFSRIRIDVVKQVMGAYGCGSIEVGNPGFETFYKGAYVDETSTVSTFSVNFLNATSFRVDTSFNRVLIIGFN